MNILILGSGAREHALAYFISKSPKTENLYIAPGNAGTQLCGENLAVDSMSVDTITNICRENKISLLVIGPEAPLVEGLVDALQNSPALENLMIIGPSKAGAMLEGSKSHAKEFMMRHNIPTASYKEYGKQDLEKATSDIEKLTPPIVIKADGLAAGKGVIIAQSQEEAKSTVREMLQESKFGEAGNTLIIEEFLDGIEMSCFALTDGSEYYLLPSSKDYKRIGEGDTGLNTGGMGAVSPVDFLDRAMMDKIKTRVIEPTIKGLQSEEIQYTGFIFFGLISVNGDPYVIEYNCRLGDPETEVILARIENDLVEILTDAATHNIVPEKLKISSDYTSTVILASQGYPESYEKGKVITGWKKITKGIIFHAGTKAENDEILSNGGRVLALTGKAPTLKEALEISYNNAELLTFEGKIYRKDIGHEFL